MIVRELVTVACDLPGCHARFATRQTDVDVARVMVERRGWTVARVRQGPDRRVVELCPPHRREVVRFIAVGGTISTEVPR